MPDPNPMTQQGSMGKDDRKVKIDGIEYYQPECHCEGNCHTCYLRPVPTVLNISLKKLLKTLTKGNK